MADPYYTYYTTNKGELLGSLGYFCATHRTEGARYPCCGIAMPRWETVGCGRDAKITGEKPKEKPLKSTA